MNNSAKRITRGLSSAIKEMIIVSIEDPSARSEICKGGGSNGGKITQLLMTRPVENIRISKDALKLCKEHSVFLYDYFLWGRDAKKLKDKYGNFFSSNFKNANDCHKVGHYITLDHNIPNTCMIDEIFKMAEDNIENFTEEKIIKILNSQSLDFITIEENDLLEKKGFKSYGTKEERDVLCSEKIDITHITDIWLTPEHIINQFFETAGINKKECLDPCACDGRWLKREGISGDILPMSAFVEERDFLKVNNLQ